MTVQDAEPPGAPRLVPILAIAGEAFALVKNNLGAWFAALLLPLVIELAVQYAMIATYGQDPLAQLQASLLQGQKLDLPTFLRGIGINLAILIAYVLFAVSWHRFALLGQAPSVIPAVQGRHVRFVLISIGVSLLVSLISIAAGLVSFALKQSSALIVILTLVATVVLLIRVQLVFPAIALDQRMTLAQSWRATRGNSLRLFWLFVLVSLPPIVLAVIVSSLFLRPMVRFALTRELDLAAAAGFVASGLVGYLLVAVLVGSISIVYRHLVLRRPATT